MSEFEIWFYRLGFLTMFGIIAYWFKRYVASQDEKNKKFFEVLDKTEIAITKLTATLESKEDRCKLVHAILDEWKKKVENKIGM